MEVYTAVAAALAQCGVKPLFGLIGDANMLYAAEFIGNYGGDYVAVDDERNAVAMTRGFATASGGVGVVTVTHGPAITHAYTALVDAARARTPLVVVTGTTPSVAEHRQAIDLAALLGPSGAGYRRVLSPRSVATTIIGAMRSAAYERRPIVVDVPADLLEQDAGETIATAEPVAYRATRPEPAGIERALELLTRARRPLILAGRGAVLADARSALIELAELSGARLTTSLLAKDFFRGHDADLGVSGLIATRAVRGILAQADCVLAFGASLNRFTTAERTLFTDAEIVQVDDDVSELGGSLEISCGIVGDARAVAVAMAERLRATGRGAPARWEASAPTAARTAAPPTAAGFVDLDAVLQTLDAALPAQRNLVTDVGRAMRAAWRNLHVDHPLGFTHTANFGSIGLGLGTAIGVALARPDRPTVAFVGDGGFMQGVTSLNTAVRRKLPLLIVVANDGAYGAEWTKLSEHGQDPLYSRSQWPDLATVARAFGARGVRIDSADGVAQLPDLIAGLDHGPVLVDLAVDPSADFGL